MFERLASGKAEIVGIAGDFRHAADADAIAEASDRDLVGFVHDGRFRCARGIGDRDRQRIALDRIDGEADAERLQQERRIAAESDDDRIGVHASAIGHDGARLPALDVERLDRRAVLEIHAELDRLCRKRVGELETVAGLVLRRQQAADDFLPDMPECRLDANAAIGIEHFIGDAVGGQGFDVLGRRVELMMRSEKLQRALHAFVIGDAGLFANLGERNATVIGKAQHAALVDRIALRGAVRQHLDEPRQHGAIDLRAQDERRVVHEQPLDRLHRNAGSGPGRAIAEGDFAGIGKARFQRRPLLPVDDRDLMARLGKLIRRCHADDTGTQNDDFHDVLREMSFGRSAILTVEAMAETGQDFIGNQAGIAREIIQGLMVSENLHHASEGESAFGQSADIDCCAVHRHAADDR